MENSFLLDNRNHKDISKQISKLASSYTPEWKYDENNPDIGSVIAMIFASQMEGNINRYNQIIDKYHTEFINMLGISLKPAIPSNSVVVMNLLRDTVEGIMVLKGTQLMAQSSDDENEDVIFETVQNIFVTGSKLKSIIQVSNNLGKVINILDKDNTNESIEELAETNIEENQIIPFGLFDFNKGSIVSNKLVLYHTNIFNVKSEKIYLNFISNNNTINVNEIIANKEKFKISYFSGENELTEFEKVELNNGVIVLEKTGEHINFNIDNVEYTAIAVEALTPIQQVMELKTIEISSSGQPVKPDFVSNTTTEQNVEEFFPFGEELSIFDECYIGCSRVFSQSGSLITIKFNVEYGEKEVSLTRKQIEDNLKVIKRKPKAILYDSKVDAYAQEISIEYYNGTGFKRLMCFSQMSSVFNGKNQGEFQIEFICPRDFAPLTIGGNEGNVIRFQLVKADNCYMRPCIHHYPIVSNLQITYSYNNNFLKPDILKRISGNTSVDLTDKLGDYETFTAFEPLPYNNNMMYLGFNKQFDNGPISILFKIKENFLINPAKLIFEYSTNNGFKPLKVIDFTEGMSKTGTIQFLPPTNFSKIEVEGKKQYYIRIVDSQNKYSEDNIYRPTIEGIYLNAVMTQNIETLETEEFYLDSVNAHMKFPVNSRNILRTDVYVNEINRHTPAKILELINSNKYTTKVVHNYLGEISEFYVLWNEVENFDNTTIEDRHYVIDRMNNTIEFGDGVNAMIPTNTTSIAFTVTTTCCSGKKGNVQKGEIKETLSNIMFVGDIFNPIKAFGGSDLESSSNALKRGSTILSSKKRLISESDYVREVMAYSDEIDKVKCICGKTIDGKKDDNVFNLVILMKDFEESSNSFNMLRNNILNYLLNKCELTVEANDLKIIEPIFVKISLDVWISIENIEDSFNIQNHIKNEIYRFFTPISTKNTSGYEIGYIPRQQQIKMMLNSIRFDGIIKNYVVSASYYDNLGEHIVDLEKINNSLFIVCVNGSHNVHVLDFRN